MKKTPALIYYATLSISLITLTSGIFASSVDVKLGYSRKATVALYNLCKTGGTVKQLKELCAQGANVNARHGEFKETALQHAAFYHHDELCEALIEMGALVNALDDVRCTALHSATENHSGMDTPCTDEQHAQTCALLLKKGVKVDQQNNQLRAALHLAVINGLFKTATVLIQHGASLSGWTDPKKSPLLLAARNGLKPMTQLLVRRKLLPLLLPQGYTVQDLRRSLKEIFFLFTAHPIWNAPSEIRLLIFYHVFARELVCLLLDSRCCHLLPIESGTYRKLIKKELQVLLNDKTIMKELHEILAAAHQAVRVEDLKTLLDPADLNKNCEELFIAPGDHVVKER